METKQSLTTASVGLSTFLSFGAKSVRPDVLEKMLIGRQKTADLLEQYVREIATNGVNQQVFMVGPRGSGKTHLLRVLYHRVQDLVQSRQVVVSYFAEEEYGISGYLDFLIRIINAFMRWYDADKVHLTEQLNILRETPESRQEDVAETLISEYIGDKPLLVLSENFDNILEALGKQGQAKLRAWLYRHNRISIIATAQAISPDLGREDRPFYGFFTPLYLKKLTYEDSLSLLVTLAETENSQTMLTHLAGKGKSQVRAIHDLVKGNHRLLVTFYEFLKADTLADLSVVFMKTMNDLKPYYETFIRYLPAQQQKILHYLALAKTPQQGTDIGKDCFIPTTSLSKQLSELQRRNLIDALSDPTDKRNKLYDVSEPLLRIAIEIGEQKEGITSLFIDFLALYYSQEEIKNQKDRFYKLYEREIEPAKKQKLSWEVEARERALKIQAEIELNQVQLDERVAGITRLGNDFFENKKYNQAINQFQKALAINAEFEWAIYGLGMTYFEQDKASEALTVFEKIIDINPDNSLAWSAIGNIYSSQDDYSNAIKYFIKSLNINPNNSTVLYDIGFAFHQQKDYNTSIIYFNDSIAIDPNDEWSVYGLGQNYYAQKNYEKAESYFQKVLRMNPENALAWKSLGDTYVDLGKLDEAINTYQKAIDIDATDEWCWVSFALVNSDLGNFKKALQAYKKAISINPNFRWPWVGLGDIFSEKRKYLKSIKYYQKAVELNLMDDYAVECLIGNIVEYLKEGKATQNDLLALKSWLQNTPRFETAFSYVNIYRRLVFANDNRALLGLQKEQREFFEKYILGKSIE